MASYKHEEFLEKSCSAAYDETHLAGSIAPYAGIYRCNACGFEIAAPKGRALPDADHHRHSNKQGAIRWRLIVFANHGTG